MLILFILLTVTMSSSNSNPDEMVSITVVNDAGDKIQLQVSRDIAEKIQECRKISKEPFKWESEQEREDALSWLSDNEEEDMIKAGCVKR